MKGATGTAESIWTKQAIHTVLNPTWEDRPWIPQAPEILDDLKVPGLLDGEGAHYYWYKISKIMSP